MIFDNPSCRRPRESGGPRERRRCGWAPAFAGATAWLLVVGAANAADRARDLGIPFEGTPAPLNAITDVAGVQVGQVTLIKD